MRRLVRPIDAAQFFGVPRSTISSLSAKPEITGVHRYGKLVDIQEIARWFIRRGDRWARNMKKAPARAPGPSGLDGME